MLKELILTICHCNVSTPFQAKPTRLSVVLSGLLLIENTAILIKQVRGNPMGDGVKVELPLNI